VLCAAPDRRAAGAEGRASGRALSARTARRTPPASGGELRSSALRAGSTGGARHSTESCADCEKLCRHWHLEQTFAPVGRPTGNAVAERFIQTLKVELIWTRDWDNIDELRAAVRVWLHSYNYERPHQALKEQTPAEKREKNLGRERFAEIFPSIAQGFSAPPPSTETGDKTPLWATVLSAFAAVPFALALPSARPAGTHRPAQLVRDQCGVLEPAGVRLLPGAAASAAPCSCPPEASGSTRGAWLPRVLPSCVCSPGRWKCRPLRSSPARTRDELRTCLCSCADFALLRGRRGLHRRGHVPPRRAVALPGLVEQHPGLRRVIDLPMSLRIHFRLSSDLSRSALNSLPAFHSGHFAEFARERPTS
jgi:hypothetical protein